MLRKDEQTGLEWHLDKFCGGCERCVKLASDTTEQARKDMINAAVLLITRAAEMAPKIPSWSEYGAGQPAVGPDHYTLLQAAEEWTHNQR